jgi:hypothetical protein
MTGILWCVGLLAVILGSFRFAVWCVDLEERHRERDRKPIYCQQRRQLRQRVSTSRAVQAPSPRRRNPNVPPARPLPVGDEAPIAPTGTPAPVDPAAVPTAGPTGYQLRPAPAFLVRVGRPHPHRWWWPRG